MLKSKKIAFGAGALAMLTIVIIIATKWGPNSNTTDSTATDSTTVSAHTVVEEKIPGREVGSNVKNVIFLIGDGMGLTQVTAGYYANGQELSFEQFKHIGLMRTHSATSIITDSAAGATAMASGKKTRNGMISMAHEDSIPLKTILEYSEDHGLATGVIATSTVTHATPASFYGHMPTRSRINERMAMQFYHSNVEVLMGGGINYFRNRNDSINLLDELTKKGYMVADSAAFDTLTRAWGPKLVCLISAMQPISYLEGRGDFLPKATRIGIEALKTRPNGFFLMVEGSQIDWGGHDNDSEEIIAEMIDFDKAVKIALDFAEKDGNTLVLVTADHETGGYAIHNGVMSKGEIEPGFTTDYHSATMVPVFAYGPGAELFQGMIDNTEIFYKLMELMGFDEDADQQTIKSRPLEYQPGKINLEALKAQIQGRKAKTN